MSNSPSASTIASPLHLRGRRDLIAEPIQFRGTRYWSVKDPLSLRYYQLCDEELFILQQVDGERSFEEIKRRFEDRFEPRKLEPRELYAFLGTLHREGLLTSRAAGQADQLLERHERAKRREHLQTLTNVLAIRFRGINPEPLLHAIYPYIRWMFSRAAILASLLLVVMALSSLLIYADAFVERLPQLQTFLSLQNVVAMAMMLGICKVLHEFGHALTCKHFGGQCHELGVMLLVFTPCLYCNVSDAWMMQSKRKRIAISAAGIYVELLLAASCTFLWWFSAPGVLNSIFLNVMFVCSVSTILFNGNPLLRYDGYFILADLVELPNLRQQSQLYFQQLAAWCLGVELRETWTVQRRHRAWLALYGIASTVYRWVLVAGILFVIYRALLPYQLESIAQLFGLIVLGGMLVAPVWQMVRIVREPQVGQAGRGWRIACIGVACGGGLVLLGMLPVSREVAAPVVVEPADAARLHVTVPGTLKQFTAIGREVAQGDVVAQLEDARLERELAELRGERGVQKLFVDQLQKVQVLERGAANDGAGSQLVTAQEALLATERRLDQKLRDYDRLTLKAPQPGTILPDRPRRAAKSTEQLATWSGNVLDTKNLGSHLDIDTIACLIGDPNALKGIAFVEQVDIERVAIGQSVRVLVDALHNQILSGVVNEIARVETGDAPPELIAKRLVPGGTDNSAAEYYAVSITLQPGQAMPLLWSSGRAKIAVQPLTLAEVVYKQLCNTFRLDL